MKKDRAKTDFIFIDESGDIGLKGTPYYSCSLIHVTNSNLKHLTESINKFRFFYDHYSEIHSRDLSPARLRKINNIINKKKRFFKTSVVYLNKEKYTGYYLRDKGKRKANPNLFKKYIYRQVIDLHFKKYILETNRVELILDKANLSEDDFINLKTYLKRWSLIPKIDSLIEVDSKYIDYIQLADVIASFFKPKIKGNSNGFSYSFINSKDISLENSRGEKY